MPSKSNSASKTLVSKKANGHATKATANRGGASYNRAKEYKGQRYTGMAVGRTHHWYYDKSDWKEKKVTPEKWEFTYATTKRRAGKAPEGSGAPVGTGYHWFILAHQYVEKLNANDYTTQMVGLKFKLAHKRAAGQKWSASVEKRRKDLIEILKALIEDLDREPEQIAPVALLEKLASALCRALLELQCERQRARSVVAYVALETPLRADRSSESVDTRRIESAAHLTQ